MTKDEGWTVLSPRQGMCSGLIREDAEMMVMILMSFFAAGKPVPDHIPSKINANPHACVAQQALQI